ncbi:MAG: hypothetical protein A2163_08015 [Actinobacteria bacterium RBG_13_35_12]|nr:MAG: hypothetical protein A2163_08015 [Actinobacteria bacterium RBG_13_35_12]
MNKRNFMLIIKSHCESPDWEDECEVETRQEAIDYFYHNLRGEYDKDWIDKNIGEEGVDF